MVDRTPQNCEAMVELLRQEFPDAKVQCSGAGSLSGTTFRILTGGRPLILHIAMDVLEDEEPYVLMRWLREVVERLRDGESLVITKAGIEPLDPRG